MKKIKNTEDLINKLESRVFRYCLLGIATALITFVATLIVIYISEVLSILQWLAAILIITVCIAVSALTIYLFESTYNKLQTVLKRDKLK